MLCFCFARTKRCHLPPHLSAHFPAPPPRIMPRNGKYPIRTCTKIHTNIGGGFIIIFPKRKPIEIFKQKMYVFKILKLTTTTTMAMAMAMTAVATKTNARFRSLGMSPLCCTGVWCLRCTRNEARLPMKAPLSIHLPCEIYIVFGAHIVVFDCRACLAQRKLHIFEFRR